MSKQIGEVYFTGGNIIKIAEVNQNGFNAHTWVKSKKDWTKKTSFYGQKFPEGTANHGHWQKLTDHDVANLSR